LKALFELPQSTRKGKDPDAVSVDPIKKGCNPPELRLIDKLLNVDNLNEAFLKVDVSIFAGKLS